jgi:uncharacterized protein YndB with AHSA1/START domain
MSYSESFEMDANAKQVFEALLDEGVLSKWLAEEVRIEPRMGGSYRFWGKDVIWCEKEAETEGEILELDAPRGLAFSWRWKGHPSRVSFAVSPNGAKSRLSIEHSFDSFDAGSSGPGPDMAGCHWRIAIGNLRSLLGGGRAALRPDYSVDTSPGENVELEIEIEAPPDRVFRALLDPAQVAVWMEAKAPEIDADKDRYSYGWTRGTPPVEVGPSRILELVPNRLLVFDWNWTDEEAGQVRWELTPSEAGTKLRLVHVNFTELANVLGWSDALFAIRALIEGRSR